MIRAHLPVTFYYDSNTVNLPRVFGRAPLRDVVEASVPRARSFYAHAGIALDIRRVNTDMSTLNGWSNYSIRSGSSEARLADVAQSEKGLTVFVSNNFSWTGRTPGTGGPSLIGSQADNRTLFDELGHALGNNPPVNDPVGIANVVADSRLLVQEAFVNRGWGLSTWFEEAFRRNAFSEQDR